MLFRSEQLSKSLKQEAGITLSINLMNTDSEFCQIIRNIMRGQEQGNHTFRFEFTENNDDKFELEMKLDTVTLPSDKTSAPMLQLNFRR